jgi:membrane protein involved in colicin uptake
MPRKSLRPELNRIRGWVRQGRTDAWIAHQLEVTVQQIQAFKREQSLEPGADPETVDAAAVDFDDEIDLRAEDDALIAAELDAEAEAKAAAEQAAAEQAAAEAAAKAEARAAKIAAGEDPDEDDDGEDADGKPKRRRGRRGGRSTRRKKPVGPLEGTFDHGEEGYGLWLDPSIQDDPVYAEYWAGHRPVEIVVEEDQILIRRVSAEGDPEVEAELTDEEPEAVAIDGEE